LHEMATAAGNAGNFYVAEQSLSRIVNDNAAFHKECAILKLHMNKAKRTEISQQIDIMLKLIGRSHDLKVGITIFYLYPNVRRPAVVTVMGTPSNANT
jgi:hypothetical protein